MKITQSLNTTLLGLATLIFSVGCSSDSPPAAPQYFLLSNSPAALSSTVSGSPDISIRSVKTPPYLSNTGLATLQADGKVAISLRQMWAEKLSQSLPTLIANELEAIIKKPVETHPLPPGINVGSIIEVQIERLIGDTQNVFLKANYRLLRNNQLKKYDFYTAIPLTDNSEKSLIAGHNQAIYALSKAIAKHL